MTHILIHSFEHAFLDSLKIFPFLFITYLIMEFLEKRAGEKTNRWLEKAGKKGNTPFSCPEKCDSVVKELLRN